MEVIATRLNTSDIDFLIKFESPWLQMQNRPSNFRTSITWCLAFKLDSVDDDVLKKI